MWVNAATYGDAAMFLSFQGMIVTIRNIEPM